MLLHARLTTSANYTDIVATGTATEPIFGGFFFFVFYSPLILVIGRVVLPVRGAVGIRNGPMRPLVFRGRRPVRRFHDLPLHPLFRGWGAPFLLLYALIFLLSRRGLILLAL